MEKKIEDLTNLNYGMISIMESIIRNEKNPILRGKYMLYQNIFMTDFSDIVTPNNKIKITRVQSNDADIVELYIPFTDTTETNLQKQLQSSEFNVSEIEQLKQKTPEQKGGEISEKDADTISELLNEKSNNQQHGGIFDDDLINDIIDIDSGELGLEDEPPKQSRVHIDNAPIKKPKTVESTKNKLEKKLNAAWADIVKEMAKELKLKPLAGKKTLSKADIIKIVMGNPKLHSRALKSIANIEMLRSDTGSDAR